MMRPSAIRGAHAVAYYDALVSDPLVAPSPSRVEDYYMETERPGIWWGQAAVELGLVGEADRADFQIVVGRP